MRILHVSDCYAPRTGGIETQVRDLARAQVAAGHEVHVLTATPGAHGERRGAVEDDDGVAVHRLGTWMPFDLPVNPAAPPHMREVLHSFDPEVVHVHAGVVSPFAFDGARVARAAGSPLAITWHCMLDGVAPVLRAGVRASRWPRHLAALSAVSRAAADRVGRVFGVPVAVVPNGLDLGSWTPGADEVAADPPPLRVVSTMRLAPRKRAVALVDAFARAAGTLPPGAITLDVFGDGPDLGRVQRAVARHGLADVVSLRGRTPRSELQAAYAAAHVFAAPAELEAFGIAALEARACGLVVVGRVGTGLAEFVSPGIDGLLVDDDDGLARGLVRLASEPGLLEALRGHARSERPGFDWDHVLAAADTEYARARDLRGST